MKNFEQQKGFGLLEVMVSFVILGFMVISLNKIHVSNRWQLAYNDSRASAMLKSQKIMDSLQVSGINAIDTGAHTAFACNDIDHGETTRVLARTFECALNVTPLDTLNGFIVSKRVNVVVSWDINNHTHNLELNGVIE